MRFILRSAVLLCGAALPVLGGQRRCDLPAMADERVKAGFATVPAFDRAKYFLPNGFKRNLGWRIDHIYCTSLLLDRVESCSIDRDARLLEKPSDHTFVTLGLR